jgi:hypothetical protein
MDAQHIQLENVTGSQPDRVILCARLQGRIEMAREDPAGIQAVVKDFSGQIAPAPQYPLGPPHGFFEGEIFQPMQRIVMNEVPHGPVVRDDLAREPNQRS